jgi:hypothetical protein
MDLKKSLKQNSPLLDLAKFAKLKGVVGDPLASLHALAGVTLQRSFSVPVFFPNSWLGSPSSMQIGYLFDEIDCQWQIYNSLCRLNSIGLPLQPVQAKTHGQLVTLIQGCKPVAEGSIIANHAGFLNVIIDNEGHTKQINVSPKRSLIQISKVSSDHSPQFLVLIFFKVIVPGSIHLLHKQTLEWIFTHGAKAVVTTSQLHTRGDFVPIPPDTLAHAFAVPAPLSLPFNDDDDFSPTQLSSVASDDNVQFEHWSPSMHDDESDDSDDESDVDDQYGQFAFEIQPVSIFLLSWIISH